MKLKDIRSVPSLLLGTTLTMALSSAWAAVPNDTLVIQQAATITTLDPALTYDTFSLQVLQNVYEPLWTYQGNSLTKLQGVLAVSLPRYTNNGKTLTVNLRRKVKFHSGNPMTCADAEYTFRRNLVTNNSDSANWFLSDSLLGSRSNANDDKSITWARIAAAVKCNASGQLVFTLSKPDPAFMSKLAFPSQGIVDKKHAISLGEWDGSEATWKSWVGKDLSNNKLGGQPSGTGPYQLLKREADNVLLKAFPGYWGGKVAIQNVIMQQVKELASRQQAFLKGDADLIEAGTRANIESQLKGQPGVVLIDNLPRTGAQSLFMNEKIKEGPVLGSGKLDGKGIPSDFFSDLDVRKAFAYSFNPQQFIKDVFRGQGQIRTMLLPDSFLGYSPNTKTYPFDLDKAKQHFQKAWGGKVWEQGFVVNANFRAGHVEGQTALEILKRNVESINPKFRVNVAEEPWSEQSKKLFVGQTILIPMGFGADYADPDNFMSTFYSSQGLFYPAHNWKDEQIDKWLLDARNTVNPNTRSALYKKVADRAYELSPFIILPMEPRLIAIRDNLQGVSANTFNPINPFNFTGTLWKDLSKK